MPNRSNSKEIKSIMKQPIPRPPFVMMNDFESVVSNGTNGDEIAGQNQIRPGSRVTDMRVRGLDWHFVVPRESQSAVEHQGS